MSLDEQLNIERNYRAYYGKLYAILLHHYGKKHISLIEDVIQNTFFKAMKIWKPNGVPENELGWLFVVAKNDMLDQIKKEGRYIFQKEFIDTSTAFKPEELDYRLEVLFYIVRATDITLKAKILFALKNIFGLHVKEISTTTLMDEEAIYKSVQRTRRKLSGNTAVAFRSDFSQLHPSEVSILTEVLYGVFSIGYDSLTYEHCVNEDICMEAFVITRTLAAQYEDIEIKHLLSLFCFHIARFDARMEEGKIVSFFEQDREQWNPEFLNAGFHYLDKPEELNHYYLEALIVSSYMTTKVYDKSFWSKIVLYYEALSAMVNSPVLQLNLCYCLLKLKKEDEAKRIIEKIEPKLKDKYYYFGLIKASLWKESGSDISEKLFRQALEKATQPIRKQYIMEKLLQNEFD